MWDCVAEACVDSHLAGGRLLCGALLDGPASRPSGATAPGWGSSVCLEDSPWRLASGGRTCWRAPACCNGLPLCMLSSQ